MKVIENLEEKIKGLIEDLHGRSLEQYTNMSKREIVMYTGEEGYNDFNLAIRRYSCRFFLEPNTKFSNEQKEKIKQMIDSSDLDNLTLAEALLEINK